MEPPRNRDNRELEDYEDEVDPEEREELNRATSSSTFFEQRWWRWAAIVVAVAVLGSFAVPAFEPLFRGDRDVPPGQGMQVPDFALSSPYHGEIMLSEAVADNDVVIILFYQTYRSSICQAQLAELQAAYPEIRALGAELLAVSTDGIADARRMADHVGAEFPVLADTAAAVARGFVVFDLLNDGLAAPSFFAITREGTLVSRYVGQDVDDRVGGQDILQFLHTIREAGVRL